MKLRFKYGERDVSITLQPMEAVSLWDAIDVIEDRVRNLGGKWYAPRRHRPDKLEFIVEASDDKRNMDDVNEARHKKKIKFEQQQMEEQRRGEQAAFDQWRRQNASRRGMSVESENVTRAEMEKRAKGK